MNAPAPRPSPALPAPAPRVAPLLLAVLAAALFARTLGNGLVNFDDHRYVPENPFALRGLAGVAAAWTTPYDDAYYPLTHTVYNAIQAVAGPAPFAHHLVQVLLWALSAALVPAALAAFRVPRAVAFWAALLWAFHPLRVESVSWAANLKDTLSLPLVLGAFALYGAGRRRAGAVSFTFALLAKSMVFPAAGLFVLLAWRDGLRFRDALARSLPFLVPAVAVAAVGAALHLGAPDRSVPGGSLLAAIPSVLWLPWWYLGRTLVPLPSQAIYVFAPVGWTDPRFLAAVALWAGVAAWVWRGRAGGIRDRVLAVGACWLPFAAVTGLVPLLHPVADRYSLLPSLGMVTLAVWAGERALARQPRRLPLAAGVLAATALALGAASFVRQGEWKDSIALWEADRDRDGRSPAGRVGLAGAYGAAERWADAARELRVVARLDPARPRNTADLFLAEASLGGMDPGRARALFQALRQGEGTGQLLEVAGSALKAGQPAAALVVIERALQLHETAVARALAAQATAALGRPDESLGHAERALALDPAREDAFVSRAIALADLERHDEALAATTRALVDPRQRALLVAVRAMVLSRLGREAEARALLEAVRGELPGVAGR